MWLYLLEQSPWRSVKDAKGVYILVDLKGSEEWAKRMVVKGG